MDIKRYCKEDEQQLFDMIKEEGEEWIDYYSDEGFKKYIIALASSITYVAYVKDVLCGYARCRDDDGFGIYVYDLLVKKKYRGKSIGKFLIEQACIDFSNQPVYVMSDVDPYYEKLGYKREGSIFEVKL
ncbi:MAG: GNAT family N-acetyltransferase [Firmicutes bacterium HGW-Firmicutes-3]|jgi:GNAT superfamily N-acetyltransferase|nr:MAG: GNAT family N-acetyltransferase [Firmicutes bacterium HGW-Firmicutes-3]